MKLITIGVYGFSESAFFAALQQAGVDTFCDIRGRRGMRGSAYAFVNSTRLQQRLAQLGIRYLHCPDLAPSAGLRHQQDKSDQAAGLTKRKRTKLSDEFIEQYRHECLVDFESARFMERFGPEARTIALFCVEGEPAACHRSLLAQRLRDDLGLELGHLLPP